FQDRTRPPRVRIQHDHEPADDRQPGLRVARVDGDDLLREPLGGGEVAGHEQRHAPGRLHRPAERHLRLSLSELPECLAHRLDGCPHRQRGTDISGGKDADLHCCAAPAISPLSLIKYAMLNPVTIIHQPSTMHQAVRAYTMLLARSREIRRAMWNLTP